MRLVIGVTGASGIRYAESLLDLLDGTDVESHLVVTENARRVAVDENGLEPGDLESKADVSHSNRDIGASVASGSFDFDGMIVCPCSMKTLGYIANGIAEGLVPRVADVCLKESRRLVLVPRESPLAHTHLVNMVRASDAGAVIAPASPGFYSGQDSVDELVTVFAAKLLDGFGVEVDEMRRWRG